MEAFAHRSLLDIEGLTRADVERILDTSEVFLQVSRRPVRKVPTLRGKTVINLFYEASTRTRTSFELAGKRLSADVINMSVSASSVKKGETLQDTCRLRRLQNRLQRHQCGRWHARTSDTGAARRVHHPA